MGITPDGPRGPRYEFKEGALIVARRAKIPLLLIGADFESAWRFRKAWDMFYLPKPFSKVRMRCELVTLDQQSRSRVNPSGLRGPGNAHVCLGEDPAERET